MPNDNQKGQFNTNFGFLMAALGSAVGLGNLWSFPYKMGIGGGFAFLVIYAIFVIFVGYPLMLSEIALGRKTQKAAIEAYKEADHRFTFNGVLQTIVPWFLICFYCTFGGYITKYLVASFVGLFNANTAITTSEALEYFGALVSPDNSFVAVLWMAFFLILTMLIVFGGVSGGIERFCKIAMPALFFMLIIIVIRACTLPDSANGLSFLFSPHADMLKKDPIGLMSLAGGQMFFSLSLSSGCIIAYGSYLSKKENLEKNAILITIGDTLVAILAGMAIFPAVFANGIEPTRGPSLLFVSMTTVFQSMGSAGRIFQFLFWLLVFFAALSSSIGMMEAGIAAILDSRIKAGKPASRVKVTVLMAVIAFLGNFLTVVDCLGGNPKMGWAHILGQGDVLSVWDCISEGVLMPLTGLIMAIMLGWFIPHYLDDEVSSSNGGVFKTKNFYNFCIKIIAPIFMAFMVWGQIKEFWG